MLLKKLETGATRSPKKRRARNATLVICILAIAFFGYRLALIYKHSKVMPVVATQDQTPDPSTITDPAGITQSPAVAQETIDGSTPGTIAKATQPIGTSYAPVKNVPQEVGIAMGSQLTGLNDADLNKEVIAMQSLGVKLVRFDMEWGFVQYSSSSKYDWSRYDRIINALNAHGIKGMAILTYTPEWARTPGCSGGAHCPPNNPTDYATYAAAAVNRYKSKGIHYWEIWNEENDYDFWATKSDCNAYTALLKAVYPAIKKADPTAYVVTGGLAQVANTNVNIAPLDFLQCIYKDGGKDYFDAVGYHPYTYPAFPSSNTTNAWARMSTGTPSLRSIMIANGDGNKQIWMTEYGTPTNGPDPKWFVSEADQAKMLTDVVNVYKTDSWAGPLFWYTFKDGGTTTDTNENFFGLVHPDYSQKPAYQTMKDILASGLN